MLKGRIDALMLLWEMHIEHATKLFVFLTRTEHLVILRLSVELGFVLGTVAEGAPIIPISAQLKYNIEVVCEYIVKKIPVPLRDFTSEPRLIGR